MGGIISFFIGLFSLGAGTTMAAKEDMDLHRKNQEYLAGNYNYSTQSMYDYGSNGLLYSRFDIDAITVAIKTDWPRMSDLNAWELAKTAAAKKLMEEETPYKYQVPDRFKYFDLDKYAADEFRVK